jgi:hypothetical protein
MSIDERVNELAQQGLQFSTREATLRLLFEESFEIEPGDKLHRVEHRLPTMFMPGMDPHEIRMAQPEGRPHLLAQESDEFFVGLSTTPDELEGDLDGSSIAGKRFVIGEPDRAHATLAEQFDQGKPATGKALTGPETSRLWAGTRVGLKGLAQAAKA